MSDNFLSELGFHLQDLVAGFSGGIANAVVFRKSNPWAVIGSVVAGAFTANYLGSPISRFLGISSLTTGFIVGLIGMALCQGIIDSAGSWNKGRDNG